jgi:hypothetical protein
VCDSNDLTGTGPSGVPSRCLSTWSSNPSRSSSTNPSTSAAVNVFVIDPIRYGTAGSARTARSTSASPAAARPMTSPARRIPSTTLGTRLPPCSRTALRRNISPVVSSCPSCPVVTSRNVAGWPPHLLGRRPSAREPDIEAGLPPGPHPRTRIVSDKRHVRSLIVVAAGTPCRTGSSYSPPLTNLTLEWCPGEHTA